MPMSMPMQTIAPFTPMSITDSEFNLIRSLVYEKIGIHLTEKKRSLVIGRLQKLLKSGGFASFKDFYNGVLKDKSEQLLDKLISRISTNYSYFFRESDHFDFFRDTALPQIVEQLQQEGSRDIRIWCAGSANGEEAYTLAMIMREFFGGDYSRWNAGILATDISSRALSFAAEGVYPEARLTNVPKNLKLKYLTKTREGEWTVAQSLRDMVTFRRFNLMNKYFPFKKPFHIIFCRNVMIYFDPPTRNALVKRFHASILSGGYFLIGHSETLGRKNGLFKYLSPALYQKECV